MLCHFILNRSWHFPCSVGNSSLHGSFKSILKEPRWFCSTIHWCPLLIQNDNRAFHSLLAESPLKNCLLEIWKLCTHTFLKTQQQHTLTNPYHVVLKSRVQTEKVKHLPKHYKLHPNVSSKPQELSCKEQHQRNDDIYLCSKTVRLPKSQWLQQDLSSSSVNRIIAKIFKGASVCTGFPRIYVENS